jgi:aspartate carbamoyltransferase catalytic subunit
MGIDLYIVRHVCPGSPHLVHKHSRKPVINAGDGRHAHPTQAMLDMFSIWERLGDLKGLRIAIVGDITHSRVVRSNLIGMKKLGAEVVVCGPRTLVPGYLPEIYGCEVEYDLKTALKDADVVMGLRMQLERQTEGLFPSGRIHQALRALQGNHPLGQERRPHHAPRSHEPRYRDSARNRRPEQSLILNQVANGVNVRMALLFLMLGGKA